MTACAAPPTTTSTRNADGTFRSGRLSEKRCDWSARLPAGSKHGYWVVGSQPIRWKRSSKAWLAYVLATCEFPHCRQRHWVNADNLLRGRTTRCKACAQASGKGTPAVRRRLSRRYQQAKQRCANGHPRYGGRGIEMRFASVRAYVDYVLQALPHKDYVGVEIDRTDNDGHYEPGNLWLVTREENVNNRTATIRTSWRGRSVPVAHAVHLLRFAYPDVRYADTTVARLLQAECASVEALVSRWRTTSSCKPRGRGTLSMPDLTIVSRYLDVSSATA